VQVLLDQHIAAAREARVLLADQHVPGGLVAHRVLRAVHEAEQVTLVEILEAVRLVDDVGDLPQPLDDLAGQLEAEVHLAGPQVEEQVAGVAGAACRGPFQDRNSCRSAGRGPPGRAGPTAGGRCR